MGSLGGSSNSQPLQLGLGLGGKTPEKTKSRETVLVLSGMHSSSQRPAQHADTAQSLLVVTAVEVNPRGRSAI